ncbi:transglycosylase SLT domain-containing protein [Streptomyces sp. TG1A-8]|uniref:transglycosylase SLT domain-containing protein n=1 Tax=Streptomyces sp. TG1A-8 TaxID=3051385 RepID=UPI00265BD39D|nr:transglycosylase SLT domain-containing protein [Streptomyces sp. TG1A-8]MDO0928356.1 transglycosylase SLT domain-containing protein [Streptomyces sp. TG1A-8]
MPKNILIRRPSPNPTKRQRIAIAGVSALGAAALALSAAPGHGDTLTTGAPATTAQVTVATGGVKDIRGSLTDQLAPQTVKLDALAAKHEAAVDAARKRAEAEAARRKAAAGAARKAAQERAAEARAAERVASRSVQRPAMQTIAARTYADNLDGWIRHALDIMRDRGIPGSYDGLHRNIMRESSGNPRAINGWDVNAINGIPSKGLLQVIPPTFNAYHVAGTSWDIYDPVANITAAANYAADRYGSIDNVNSAY